MSHTITLIAFIILLLGSVNGTSQEARFLFDGSFSGENHDQQVLSRSFKEVFRVDVNQAIQREFPCASVSYLDDISRFCIAELELQRHPAFGDQNVDERKNKLLNLVNNSDYWVSFCFYPISDDIAIASLKCSDKKGKTLVKFSIETTCRDLILNHPSQAVTKFIKELSKYEICPYTGPINIEVKTELTDKQTESYPVYCNGMDGIYKLEKSINKTSLASWKLNKTDIFQTNGTVIYTLREETQTDEQNDCHTCPSGRLGPRWYKETVLKTSKIEGLSSESVANNQQIEDARAEITFLENGTYTLKVKVASRKGDLKLRTEKKAEGTCDNQNPPPEKIDKKADVPLKDTTFGPFPGTSLHKVLSHKDTFTTIDPVTKEKTIITYDFDLKRD